MNTFVPKKLAVAVAASLFGMYAGTSAATPAFLTPGTNLTTGSVSHAHSLFGNINNPAAAARLVKPEENTYKVGILSSIGMAVEFGPVDGMIDELDRLSTQLDRTDLTAAEADELINGDGGFNDFLTRAGEDGYLEFSGGLNVPTMPLVVAHQSLKGAVTVDASVGMQGRLSVLDSPVTYNPTTNGMETGTALYIKGAVQTEVSAGYGRELMKFANGTLYVGGRAKFVQMGLKKLVQNVSDTNDIQQTFEDEIDAGLNTTSGVALDAGVLWVRDFYQVGLTVHNINEPEFDYDPIGQNCDALTGTSQTNCYTAQAHASRIDLEETHVMNAYSTLEASAYTKSGNAVVSLAYDLNKAITPVGSEQQYLVISAGYLANGLIPGARIGYRQNQVGSKLNELTLGFTFFKNAHLDLAYGLDSVDIDGNTAPRRFGMNFGVDVTF